jgi:glycine cleavage system T protein
MGWRDIVVLEKGPLFETGGSTSLAPGLAFQTSSSKTMTKFAQYTLDLYSQLPSPRKDKACAHLIGGMEVAYTKERWQDLERKLGFAKSWGVQAELISPEQAKEKIPLLDSTKILGALFVPTDGIVNPVLTAETLAKEAQKAGASLYANTPVTDIKIDRGRVAEVVTPKGRILTNNVLLCAGIWGRKIGQMVGITIPLNPMQHQYVLTGPLQELGDEKRAIVHPILRHQDKRMYFRQVGSSYGIGSYDHEPMPLDPYDPNLSALMNFTPQSFQRALDSAGELLPSLRKVKPVYEINGVFSFTPDAMPAMGEARDLKGFWVAEAVWVTHSGGVGKAIAEWMTQGYTSLDLRECDINRFHKHALTPSYIRARAIQQYKEVYDIIHPLQQIQDMRNIRLSPFHIRLSQLGGVFFENAGWERPQWFENNKDLLNEHSSDKKWPIRSGWEALYWSPIQGIEHYATRSQVAVYDLTPFTKIDVRGPKSLDFLQYLSTNQIDQPIGKVVYTSMLDKKGGIMCDLTITRLNEYYFRVITGGSVGMHDLAWMYNNLPEDHSVELIDVTSMHCCIGLWGPRARDVVESVSEDDFSINGFPYFTAKEISIGPIPAIALRVSYVGEPGWEIYTNSENGIRLWDSLWEAGKPFGIIAGGLAAFDSLRLEKGYRLWGSDIHTEYNPYEAGLSFVVKLEKSSDFIGREALIHLREKGGIERKLCCMTLDDETKVVMGKEPIMDGDKVLGYVTSANFGYTVGRGIVYGYLPLDYAKEGTNVEVYYFGKKYSATVRKEPLIPTLRTQ